MHKFRVLTQNQNSQSNFFKNLIEICLGYLLISEKNRFKGPSAEFLIKKKVNLMKKPNKQKK